MEKREPQGPIARRALDVIDLRTSPACGNADIPKNTVVVGRASAPIRCTSSVSGRVKIYVATRARRSCSASRAREYFGEMVLDEGPRSASVMTLVPTQFLVVAEGGLQGIVTKSPEFALHLILKLIKRLRHAHQRREDSRAHGRVRPACAHASRSRGGARRRSCRRKPAERRRWPLAPALPRMIGKILDDLARAATSRSRATHHHRPRAAADVVATRIQSARSLFARMILAPARVVAPHDRVETPPRNPEGSDAKLRKTARHAGSATPRGCPRELVENRLWRSAVCEDAVPPRDAQSRKERIERNRTGSCSSGALP